MGEGLVRLRHTMRIVLLLHGAAAHGGRVHEFRRQALAHRLLAARPRIEHEPAHPERDTALRTHLDGNLIRRTVDAPAIYLELRLHVVERLPEYLERVFLEARLDDVEGAVED